MQGWIYHANIHQRFIMDINDGHSVMPIDRRRYLSTLGSGAVGIGLTGCLGDASSKGQGDGPITVGASISQTGPYAKTASYTLEAFKQWRDEINNNGGLLGRDVEWKFYDDQSDPEQATQLYRKLISDDNVDLLMGPFGSPVAKAAAPIQEQKQMATINPMASDSGIWTDNDFDYVFQGIGIARNYIRDAVVLAAERGAESIAFAHPETSFPTAATDGAIEHAEKNGIEVLDRITYTRDEGNYSQIASDLANQEPDVIAGGGYFPDAANLTRGFRSVGYNADMYVFYSAVASSDFSDTLGSTANGITGNTAWDANADTEGNSAFIEAYKQKWDRMPDYHSAGGYAAGQVLRKAVEEAGEIDQDAIRKKLANNTYQSVFGTWNVDDQNVQTGYGHLIIQWQNGEKEIVAPEEAATGDVVYPAPTWSEK